MTPVISAHTDRRVLPLVIACLGLLARCTSDVTETPLNCAPVGGRPALAVILRDASNGAYSPFFDAKVVAYNTIHVDSAQRDTIRSIVALKLLPDKPGIYDLRVTASGYKTAQRKVFTVRSSECGGQTDTVLVTLQRQ